MNCWPQSRQVRVLSWKLTKLGPFWPRGLRSAPQSVATARLLAALQGETHAEADEHDAGDALERAPQRATRERCRDAAEHIRVRGEPRDAHDGMERREEERLREDVPVR